MAANTDEIILIDSYSVIYRNYYALGHLSNSKGQPTNAMLGMLKFLLRFSKDYRSAYGAFAFDLGKSKARLELASQYKANRPPMPEDLRAQIPHIRRAIEAFGWVVLEKEGFEADDIIAAVTEDFKEFPVKIVTSDKDISQLVDSRVKILAPAPKGGFFIQGTEEVIEKFDVRPEQIVDYLSIVGDNSDNIPGIEGLGPKSAAKLMKDFGSIKNMLANLASIDNEKRREKLAASAGLLEKNIKLISLIKDIPERSWKNISDIARKEPDWETIKNIAVDFELKSVLAELEKINSVPDTSIVTEPDQKEEKKPEQYTPDLFSSL